MSEKTKKLIVAAAKRAIRTVAQAALGAIGGAATMGAVDWRLVASTAVLAGITSMLMSVATGLPEAKQEGDGLHG